MLGLGLGFWSWWNMLSMATYIMFRERVRQNAVRVWERLLENHRRIIRRFERTTNRWIGPWTKASRFCMMANAMRCGGEWWTPRLGPKACEPVKVTGSNAVRSCKTALVYVWIDAVAKYGFFHNLLMNHITIYGNIHYIIVCMNCCSCEMRLLS